MRKIIKILSLENIFLSRGCFFSQGPSTSYLMRSGEREPLDISKLKSRITHHDQPFVDYCRVVCVGGRGGSGLISFLRLYANEFAGPDGGNGGNGGHVIFQVDSNVTSLNHIRSPCVGNSGINGKAKSCHGATAEHRYIKVPLGTILKTGKKSFILNQPGEIFIGARGGNGGRGNACFLSNENRSPRMAESGAPGEEIVYEVELKIMADAGLVGFPNSGKSTLLRAISRARPKVASYPFTTLKPHVGMVQYDDYHQIPVADIPGLIEGSHLDEGLGVAFLRHLERCLCLLYVIDLSHDRPWEQLEALKYELDSFRPGLSNRPSAIVANKIDLVESEERVNLLKSHTSLPVFPVSAKYQIALRPFLIFLRQICSQTRSLLTETTELTNNESYICNEP